MIRSFSFDFMAVKLKQLCTEGCIRVKPDQISSTLRWRLQEFRCQTFYTISKKKYIYIYTESLRSANKKKPNRTELLKLFWVKRGRDVFKEYK